MIDKFAVNNHKGWLLYCEANESGVYTFGNKKWDLSLDHNPISVFDNQKFVIDNSDFFLLFDGVVFNWNELYTNADSYYTILKHLWLKESYNFPKLLRGSFNGIILDKKKEELIIFNDHIGSKAVYYSILPNKDIIISSDIAKIYDLRIKLGVSNDLSVSSAQNLLSSGFMIGNETLCNGVKRLIPGSILRINKSEEEIKYYKLNNEENTNLSEPEIIDKIDHLFIQAIKRQYISDIQIGGGSLVCLSGGLDSRMTSLIGHKLGFRNQLNITFSQSGYLDESIAQQIASDYNHDWLFKSLDTGNYLTLVDEITEYTGGNVLYYGLAHGYSLTKLMNLSGFGILHSGQLGDVVLGTYFSSMDHSKKYSISDGAFGSMKTMDDINFSMEYPNEEIGKFYNRGFNGILISGHTLIQQHLETASPFLDFDFMQFCLQIPLKYRYNHYIYKKWIMTKHPEMAKYEWEKIKAKISTPQISVLGREIPVTQVPNVFSNKIYRIISGNKDVLMTKKHMNPIAYQIANNKYVKDFLDNYYVKYIDLVTDKDISNTLHQLYNNGNSMDKIICISLLSAVKRFKLV